MERMRPGSVAFLRDSTRLPWKMTFNLALILELMKWAIIANHGVVSSVCVCWYANLPIFGHGLTQGVGIW